MQIELEKQALLDDIVARLSQVRGVRAVVLGGSYARGMQRPGSDLDVGIYYYETQPFAIADIHAVASAISASGTAEVTDFYGWGAWVNGGGWIHSAHGKVDFIYRSIQQVMRTIDQAEQGGTAHDYFQQPAYGFFSTVYLAETQVCVPLYDPLGIIAAMKTRVAVYPPALKEKTVASMLWLAEFSLIHAESFARSGDRFATPGTLARAAYCVTLALFALNETYYMSDKTALREMAVFRLAPDDFGERLGAVLAHPGETHEEMLRAVADLRGLWAEVVALTGGTYRPAFSVE